MSNAPQNQRVTDLATFSAIFDICRRMKQDQALRDIHFTLESSNPFRLAWNPWVALWVCQTRPGARATFKFQRGGRFLIRTIEYTAAMGCGFVYNAGPLKFVFLLSTYHILFDSVLGCFHHVITFLFNLHKCCETDENSMASS